MKRCLYILILLFGCKDVYNPPLKNSNTNYLVVEGNIIAGNDSTIVHLSRTTAVNDTNGINKPETNASITVESEDGESYALQNESNGNYDAPPLNISQNKKYRLHIFTADGKEYASDYVTVKITPPIDDVTWKFDMAKGVTVYVSSHDAQSNTHYYQWNFTETWQHKSAYTSGLVFEGDSFRVRRPDEYINNCWTVLSSSSINVASTTQLSSDAVFERPLVNIPYNSEKLGIVYSILVKQNALTKEAFEFWQNLQKNTENLGTIFDPQPFADFGNIHCITNVAEPVIGFISAGSVAEKRIYINNADLTSWGYTIPFCDSDTIPPATVNELETGAQLPVTYVPISGSPAPGILITSVECADCRFQGGSTIKPPYMP